VGEKEKRKQFPGGERPMRVLCGGPKSRRGIRNVTTTRERVQGGHGKWGRKSVGETVYIKLFGVSYPPKKLKKTKRLWDGGGGLPGKRSNWKEEGKGGKKKG